MIWSGNKILAVIIGAFIGTWASHLIGASPPLSVTVGIAVGLVTFLAIRKR